MLTELFVHKVQLNPQIVCYSTRGNPKTMKLYSADLDWIHAVLIGQMKKPSIDLSSAPEEEST